MENTALKLYTGLATWWPLLSPVSEYADEAVFFWQILQEAGCPPNGSLLELGSGGGNNAFYLKSHFARVTLTDLSPEMLAVSRRLNPDCEHLQGDMRTLRLRQKFDVVFVHDAIDYMLSVEDLRQVLQTAALHCRPNGLVLLVPDHVRETFEPSTEHGGTDGEGRGLRYLEWTYDPDGTDSTYITEYVYLLREGQQAVHVEHERHTCGLFARAQWLQLLQEAGFQPKIIHDPIARELFLARKTAS